MSQERPKTYIQLEAGIRLENIQFNTASTPEKIAKEAFEIRNIDTNTLKTSEFKALDDETETQEVSQQPEAI